MKHPILKSVLLLIALYTLQSFNRDSEWSKGGPNREFYTMGIDSNTERNHISVRTIQSAEKVPSGFGTYTTEISANKYAGKHIRMTGFVKTSHSDLTGGLWLMTDGTFLKEPVKSNFLCNTNHNATKQGSDWTKQEIEFDIPVDANAIQYGAFLKGNGQIWFDDLQIEIASESAGTSDIH